MSVVINGTTGITTPDLASGPVAGTTANFSGNVTLGSSVLATPSGSAPSYTCRAWVNFNGTTTTPTIRASGNVSSVTRNGTGDYTVNFTTAMADINYSFQATGGRNSTNFASVCSYRFDVSTASSARFQAGVVNGAGTSIPEDQTYLNVAIFR